MQQLQDQLKSYSSSLLTDPAAGTAPFRAAATSRINRRYAALPGNVSQALASRGYGSSGNFGNTMYQSEYARSGELSDLDAAMAQMILGQKAQGASLSEQLLSLNRGSRTEGTGPGTALPDAFMSSGNALSNISTLMTLSKVLKGAGGGSGYTSYGYGGRDPGYEYSGG